MYTIILVLTLAFFVLMSSQFGRAFSARHALLWYFAGGLVLFSELRPPLLYRISSFLGVAVPSNLVFAGLILMGGFLLLEQEAMLTRLSRSLRKLTSSEAADGFRGNARRKGAALVVVPCYNESEILPSVIQKLSLVTEQSDFLIEYCVVDDGSTDASKQILKTLAPGAFVPHRVNIGVAGVLLTGFQAAIAGGYSYVVQCDGDGQHPMELIPALLDEAKSRNADLLIGSRFLAPPGAGEEARRGHPQAHRLAGIRWITLLLRLFHIPASVTDPTSGFRVYSRKAIEALILAMPDEYPEPESIALLSLARMNIQETWTPMHPRNTGRSSLAGLQGARFMVKVTSALLGIRLRSLRSAWGP